MSIAGLDIGTSGCKCTIFADDGVLNSYAYREYSFEVGPFGYLELNPNTVWQNIVEVISEAVSNNDGDDVKAMSIISFGEAGVPIDKNGDVLYMSFPYTDPRGREECNELIQKVGKREIMSRSGHNPHPMFPACKLMWLRNHKRDVFDNMVTFMQYSDYILYKLSGEKYVDWSLASRTLMFNVINKDWDDVMMEAAGLSPDMFPKPVRAGIPIAEVNAKAADETGLKKGTILVLGGQDQIGAVIGGGALKAGQAVNSLGSVDCITPVFDRPLINDAMAEGSYSCVPHAVPDHYVTFVFNFSGGSMLKWYRDKFGQMAVKQGAAEGRSPYTIMEESAPDEPTGLLMLPHLQGASTPYMDIDAVGAVVGLTTRTDSGTFYRALMEGAAYEMMVNIDALKKAGVYIDRLTACGGGSRSPMWMQLRADLFNIPIDLLEFEEAGTLGAAVIAGAACGVFKDFEDGVNQLVKVKKTYYPNPKTNEIYEEHYTKYKRMYNCVREIMGRET